MDPILRFFQRTAFILLVLATLPACSAQISQIPQADIPAIQAYADPAANRLLAAMRDGDYASFSKDFDTIFRRVMAESNFKEMMKSLDASIGLCSAAQFLQAQNVDGQVAVTYRLSCAKDPAASMQVVFSPEEPHQIGGVYFDSPGLQK